MKEKKPKFLPLGTSDFIALRMRDQIYVDKTELVYQLARLPGKFFLSRPRRFGKSLLISTFESLFKYGLRDFQNLAIEKLWKEEKTYSVVRLDFSEIKNFISLDNFFKKLTALLLRSFAPLGFNYVTDPVEDITDQLSSWLESLPPNSLVVLIDEYDAPLTACLNNRELFHAIRSVLS